MGGYVILFNVTENEQRKKTRQEINSQRLHLRKRRRETKNKKKKGLGPLRIEHHTIRTDTKDNLVV